MPGRPTDQRARVLGPYWVAPRQQWRLIVITPDGDAPGKTRQTSFHYRSEDEANEEKRDLEESICNITVSTAIDTYERHLEDKGTVGYVETIRRIRLFFPDHAMLLGRITPDRGKKWYEDFRARLRPDGDPISVSYHRAALINARSMLTFCIDEKRWLRDNPLAKVKGIGKRESGKTVHTTDEATKLVDYCLMRAELGDATALGVLLALALALRSSDLTRRIVRDVDQGGALLRVSNGKSEKSNRPRKVPVMLRPLLLKLAAGRPSFEPLFPWRRKGQVLHHTRRWLEEGMVRFCKAAGVPYVCPHALKSTAGEAMAEDGAAAEAIIAHLSHEDGSTTRRHYVRSGSIEAGAAARGFAVLTGGKK